MAATRLCLGRKFPEQGDSLGPFLFAVGYHTSLLEIL